MFPEFGDAVIKFTSAKALLLIFKLFDWVEINTNFIDITPEVRQELMTFFDIDKSYLSTLITELCKHEIIKKKHDRYLLNP